MGGFAFSKGNGEGGGGDGEGGHYFHGRPQVVWWDSKGKKQGTTLIPIRSCCPLTLTTGREPWHFNINPITLPGM